MQYSVYISHCFYITKYVFATEKETVHLYIEFVIKTLNIALFSKRPEKKVRKNVSWFQLYFACDTVLWHIQNNVLNYAKKITTPSEN